MQRLAMDLRHAHTIFIDLEADAEVSYVIDAYTDVEVEAAATQDAEANAKRGIARHIRKAEWPQRHVTGRRTSKSWRLL